MHDNDSGYLEQGAIRLFAQRGGSQGLSEKAYADTGGWE